MHIRTSDDTCERLERIWASDRLHVRRMLIGLTRDIDLADDLLQETYLKARDGISGYRGDNDRAWLCAVARNAFMSHIRRRYVSAETSDGAECTASYSPVGTPDHIELMRVRDAMSALGPDLRIALLMKHYCGFTYREIAQSTHCPVGTAKWRVSVAIGRLQETLGVKEGQMEMKCTGLSRSRIIDYCYGALASDEMKAIEHHVQGCPNCQSRLDDTSKITSALDALESERKYVHIVELDENGVPTLYAILRMLKPESGEFSCYVTKDIEMEYVEANGEELKFSLEENDSPDYHNTYSCILKFPSTMPSGETINLVMVCHLPIYPAIKEPDGSWAFHFGQLDSVDHEWAYVLAVRIPAGSRVISADPPGLETIDSTRTTLLWRTVQAANQPFQCNIRYKLDD